jgi:hypothetical protein
LLDAEQFRAQQLSIPAVMVTLSPKCRKPKLFEHYAILLARARPG